MRCIAEPLKHVGTRISAQSARGTNLAKRSLKS